MVMGTASTMACVAEALGLALPGSATAPAATGDRLRAGAAAGRAAVDAGAARRRPPRELLSPASFRNALVVLAAIGGSTNAVVHLLAIARRAGVPLDPRRLRAVIAREVPVLVDCKPAGAGYLEDLHRAGGVPALLAGAAPRCSTRTRRWSRAARSADRLARGPAGPGVGTSAIRAPDDPVGPAGGIAVLRGSLAPDGAVIKAAAATPAPAPARGPGRRVRVARRRRRPHRRPCPGVHRGLGAGAAQRRSGRGRDARGRLDARSRARWRRAGSATWCASRTPG